MKKSYIHLKGKDFELYANITDAAKVEGALSTYKLNLDMRGAAVELVYEQQFKEWYWLHKGAELGRIEKGKYFYLERKNFQILNQLY